MSTLDAKILQAWTSLETLAKDRFDAYKRTGDADELDAMARYVWACDVAKSLHPRLHGLEVAFRNQVHNSLTTLYGPLWYDMPSLLITDELRRVDEAKQSIRLLKKVETPGRVVSELSFGFWTSLYGRHHEHDIVRPTILSVFPHYRGSKPIQRGSIAPRLRDARFLRNRISHFEHVAFDPRLPTIHAEICETTAWMSAEMEILADLGDDFRRIYGQSWQHYRPLLEARLS